MSNVGLRLWDVMDDVGKLPQLSLGVMFDTTIQDLAKVRTGIGTIEVNKVPADVLAVARYIMVLEPSFQNSRGDTLHLAQVRSQLEFTEQQIEFVVSKLLPVVKDYISVTKGTESLGDKLRINSELSKSVLIEKAIRHLLTGYLVTEEKGVFVNIKVASYLKRGLLQDYITLANYALALQYDSVHEMMEQFVLPFIDQRNSLTEKGMFTFYDGMVSTLTLGG